MHLVGNFRYTLYNKMHGLNNIKFVNAKQAYEVKNLVHLVGNFRYTLYNKMHGLNNIKSKPYIGRRNCSVKTSGKGSGTGAAPAQQ